MNHPGIQQQLTYLIFPFTFEKEYQEVTKIPNFAEKKVSKDNVFDHVAKLITSQTDVEGRIGKAFVLPKNKRKPVGLPNFDQVLTLTTKGDEYLFKIDEINLYLFETQVGFLTYQVSILDKDPERPPSIQRYIESTYHLKRFYYSSYKLSSTDGEVFLENVTTQLLDSLTIESYFEKQDRAHHSISFSAVLLGTLKEEEEKRIPEYLFQMRKSFTDSYLPSKYDLDIDNNSSIFQPFGNSIWGVSMEAISNIAFLTGEDKTDKFFQNGFFNNLERTYFYLYLLALQQKYTLLKLSVAAGSLHEQISELTLAKQSETVNLFKERVIRFLVRSNYKQVSYVTHHADLYKTIRSQLGIDDLLEEINSEVEALSSFIDIKEERENRKKETRMNNLIQFITLAFLPITVLTGIFGMNIPPFTGMKTNLPFIITLIFSYLISGGLLYLFRKSK